MPRGVGREVVDGWIRTGVGTHVALWLDEALALLEMTALLEAEGFIVPRLFSAGALIAQSEQMSVIYFEGGPEGSTRLELCASP
jgi:hypothetical protein